MHLDLISRNKVMAFGQSNCPEEVNFMATSKSRQVEVYFTSLEDNKATALDAFTEDWSRFRLAYI